MIAEPTITVEFTAYEARAMARSAMLLAGACENAGIDASAALPDGHSISPLHSAVMKLELALVVAQEEL